MKRNEMKWNETERNEMERDWILAQKVLYRMTTVQIIPLWTAKTEQLSTWVVLLRISIEPSWVFVWLQIEIEICMFATRNVSIIRMHKWI